MEFSPKTQHFSVPGKIFLLGEYLAITGGPSLVAAVGPRAHFYDLDPAKEEIEELRFHPDSPAGKLLDWGLKRFGSNFRIFGNSKQLRNQKGLGSSTAEFAAVYQILSKTLPLDAQAVWTLYRECVGSQMNSPSGADLVAQWEGGLVEFRRDPFLIKKRRFHFPNLFIFTAASKRKIETHAHLQNLNASIFSDQKLKSDLNNIFEQGVNALERGDEVQWGATLSAYANRLNDAQLEHPEAHLDRVLFESLPFVLGAKGCGALLADLLLVQVKSDITESEKNALMIRAQSCGLKLLSHGLQIERGIQIE